MSGIRPFGLWLYLVIGFAIAFRLSHWHKECHGSSATDAQIVIMAIGWAVIIPGFGVASINVETPPLHCEVHTP